MNYDNLLGLYYGNKEVVKGLIDGNIFYEKWNYIRNGLTNLYDVDAIAQEPDSSGRLYCYNKFEDDFPPDYLPTPSLNNNVFIETEDGIGKSLHYSSGEIAFGISIKADSQINLSHIQTIEIVVKPTNSGKSMQSIIEGPNNISINWLNAANGSYQPGTFIITNRVKNSIYDITYRPVYYVPLNSFYNRRHVITVNTARELYIDGLAIEAIPGGALSSNLGEVNNLLNKVFVLGTSYAFKNGSYSLNSSYSSGNIYQIRCYGRSLTASEIIHNHRIDLRRYGISNQ